jgi:hypothetical protein
LGTASRFVAFALIGLSGCALLIASPALLLLGAWAGADGGSVPKGLANVLGVPWLIFITCLGRDVDGETPSFVSLDCCGHSADHRIMDLYVVSKINEDSIERKAARPFVRHPIHLGRA